MVGAKCIDSCCADWSALFLFYPTSFVVILQGWGFGKKRVGGVASLLSLRSSSVGVSSVVVRNRAGALVVRAPPITDCYPVYKFHVRSHNMGGEAVGRPVLRSNCSLVLLLGRHH